MPLYSADIIFDQNDGEMGLKKIRVVNDFEEFVNKIIEYIDEHGEENPELWTSLQIYNTENQSILIKVLATIKSIKGEEYAKKLNKIHAKTVW